MEILTEALNDTLRLVPLLAFIYFFIGFLEYRYGDRINHFMMHLGIMGPVVGALFGCIPQCGFSVVAAALYVKRMMSLGTFLAILLSTSDEAVPILLSMPGKAGMVALLIVLKVIIAIAAGLAVDYFIRTPAKEASGEALEVHAGCCRHGLAETRSKLKTLFLHPLLHTAKIFAFLFILTVIFNFSVEKIGRDRIGSIFFGGTIFQPVLASFIGLIPNCFASVLLANLFTEGVISFGSMVAGLCTGSGLGILVLMKENKDVKDTMRVIGLLLAISVAVGILIQLISSIS